MDLNKIIFVLFSILLIYNCYSLYISIINQNYIGIVISVVLILLVLCFTFPTIKGIIRFIKYELLRNRYKKSNLGYKLFKFLLCTLIPKHKFIKGVTVSNIETLTNKKVKICSRCGILKGIDKDYDKSSTYIKWNKPIEY